MPSEPMAEPTLEELSAYLDHELDADAQARVADHLGSCADCQLRLDGLRETVYAVRALPMETPPRTFTIPAQQRQRFRWAPAGWIGGVAAAAALVVAIGITHFPAGGTSTAGSFFNGSTHRAEGGAAVPVLAPAASSPNQSFDARAGTTMSKTVATVADPTNGTRKLVLDTDAASYSTNGKMRVTVQLQGSPSSSTNSGDQGLTLSLVRNGAGVALRPVGVSSWNGTPIFGGTYELGGLPLAGPRAGDYLLEATWVIPDGSGRVLQVSVPIQLTGS